jgi:hypothetical protein
VFVALDPPHWTLDPNKLMQSITGRTKAIVLNRLVNFIKGIQNGVLVRTCTRSEKCSSKSQSIYF